MNPPISTATIGGFFMGKQHTIADDNFSIWNPQNLYEISDIFKLAQFVPDHGNRNASDLPVDRCLKITHILMLP
jgi:hypothetical protein